MKKILISLVIFITSCYQLMASSGSLLENIGKGDLSYWKGVSIVDKDGAVSLANN